MILSLCIVTPLGFWCKSYCGAGAWWFGDYGGGVMYEIFWCLVFFLFFYKESHITKIAVSVLVVTCLLETLQLWHPVFLQQVRMTFLGRTLLGTTFVWWDFPYYVLGCVLGWLWMKCIILFVKQRHIEDSGI